MILDVLSVCGGKLLFYATVCWGGSIKHKDARRLDKLVERAGSVIGTRLDSWGAVVEWCTQKKVEAILNYTDHPLHNIFTDQRNSGTGRLISLLCRTERYRRSFIPMAIRLYNSLANGRWAAKHLNFPSGINEVHSILFHSIPMADFMH